LDLEFDYIVSPDAFNIEIEYNTEGFKCERVYGSPGFEIPKAGLILQLSSTFPSQKKDKIYTKGGAILIKLNLISDKPVIKFRTSYNDRDDNRYKEEEVFEFPKSDGTKDVFQGSAVRKAVLLTRYVNFMRYFALDVYQRKDSPTVNAVNGIPVPPIETNNYTHSPVIPKLSPERLEMINKFINYFSSEADALGDLDLTKELTILNKVLKQNTESIKYIITETK